MAKSKSSQNRIKTLAAVGVFTALAYVCCVLFHFKASFLTFDLKDAVMTVGAMIFDPAWGFAMSVAVALIEFCTISGTGVYGLIMNLLSSTVFVCTASFIYSRRRTMGGALFAVFTSVILTVTVMMGANLLIAPYYTNVEREVVVKMIPTLLLPFNLTKSVFNSAVVFLLYKPLITALRNAGFFTSRDSAQTKAFALFRDKKSVVIAAASLAVAVLAMIFFFICLGGEFSFT